MIKLNKVLATSLATLTLAGSSSQVFAARSKRPQKSLTSSATNATRQKRINAQPYDRELVEFAYKVFCDTPREEPIPNILRVAALVLVQKLGENPFLMPDRNTFKSLLHPRQLLRQYRFGIGDKTVTWTSEQAIDTFTLYFLNCKINEISDQNEDSDEAASHITYRFISKYYDFLCNSQDNTNISPELREFAKKMVKFIVKFKNSYDLKKEIYRKNICELTSGIDVDLNREELLDKFGDSIKHLKPEEKARLAMNFSTIMEIEGPNALPCLDILKNYLEQNLNNQ